MALATIPHLGERLAYKKTTASVTEMRGNNSIGYCQATHPLKITLGAFARTRGMHLDHPSLLGSRL